MRETITRPTRYELGRSLWRRLIRRDEGRPDQQEKPEDIDLCVCELWGSGTCPACSPVLDEQP
jgi:hypothetical protein